MAIEIKEVNEAELKTFSGRGIWDREGILSFAKELNEKFSNKVIGFPLETIGKIEGFYNKFYKGSGRIKYIGYYCKKYLTEAFSLANINATVRTNKNSVLVQLKESDEEIEQDEELED